MRLSFLAFFATVVSAAEGSALRGLDNDETEGQSSFDAERRIAADEDVDSRPFLHVRPPRARTLLARVLQSLDFIGNDIDDYERCEGDCDEDDDCDDGLVCFQR